MLYQKYLTAHSLTEALTWLGQANGAPPRLVAGGTDLILQLHERLVAAESLIDISQIPELRGVGLAEGWLTVGAATTYAELARSPLIRQHAYLLAEASQQIGAAQIQNMATLGGNLGNASPAADAIPCLYALEAQVVVRSLDGERMIPITEFHQGYRQIDLRRGELITALRLPAPSANRGTAFVKFGLRKSQAIAVVNVAVVLHLAAKKITQAAVALGAVAPTIIRSPQAEQVLIGHAPTPKLFEQAGQAARADARPIDDIRGSAAFRSHLVGVCTQRALQAAWERVATVQ